MGRHGDHRRGPEDQRRHLVRSLTLPPERPDRETGQDQTGGNEVQPGRELQSGHRLGDLEQKVGRAGEESLLTGIAGEEPEDPRPDARVGHVSERDRAHEREWHPPVLGPPEGGKDDHRVHLE
jgi:hypothetical protein